MEASPASMGAVVLLARPTWSVGLIAQRVWTASVKALTAPRIAIAPAGFVQRCTPAWNVKWMISVGQACASTICVRPVATTMAALMVFARPMPASTVDSMTIATQGLAWLIASRIPVQPARLMNTAPTARLISVLRVAALSVEKMQIVARDLCVVAGSALYHRVPVRHPRPIPWAPS